MVLDTAAVAEAFRGWCQARFGQAVELTELASTVGDGFDNQIVFVHPRGPAVPDSWQRPLVLRIQPDAERLETAYREAAIHGWCADRGYPAPRVLAVLEPGELFDVSIEVMERLPGVTMLRAITAAPWRSRAYLRQLAELHAELHALPTTDFPADECAYADRVLGMPREFAPRIGDVKLLRALERAELIATTLEVDEPAVCHGDFHPLNVVVDTHVGDAGVIDWTDCGLGDRHGDVSRTALLFLVASVAANSASERLALKAAGPLMRRRYLRVYESMLPLDHERVRRWEALHCVSGWTQVLALHAGMFDGSNSPDDNRDRVSPQLASWLEARCERAMQ